MTQPSVTRVQNSLAERTGTNPRDWYLVFKARYGMQVVFEELARQARGAGPGAQARGAESGDRPAPLGARPAVVTQAFTCATAVDPILVAGLRPEYRDIERETFSLDPARLSLPADAVAVVLQHTFGIISPRAGEVAAAARLAGALVLEDAAHCVGRMAVGADGRPIADVSVHSFGVEKMLPTRFGAAIWVSPDLPDRALRARIAGALAGLPTIGPRLDLAARSFKTQVRVLNRLGSGARPTRTALTRLGLFEPAIAPVEQVGELPYPPMQPSPWIVGQMAKHLAKLDDVERQRSAAVAVYDQLPEATPAPGAAPVKTSAGSMRAAPASAAPLVRYPRLAADQAEAEAIIDYLTKNGVFAGHWYRPMLYPVGTEEPLYNYSHSDDLPVTRELTTRVFNLPTNVSEAEAHRIAKLLRDRQLLA